MDGESNYNCEIYGGNHPTEEHSSSVETMVKVEAKPAKEILDNWYQPEPDYGDYDIPENDYPSQYTTELLKKEELSYVPFEPRMALGNLRKFSPEEMELPVEERRAIVKARIEELKTKLVEQQLGMSTIIQDLKRMVTENPQLSGEELYTEVKKQAANYNLGESHLYIFKTAIEDYELKHKLVEKYRAMYLDDKDLFEACFGQKPKGEVSVTKSPMTLHFQCHSRDDYALAYNFQKLRENEEVSEEDKRKLIYQEALLCTE